MEKPLYALVEDILNRSAWLQMKGATNGAGITLIAHAIAEHINAQYELIEKKPWYGRDLDKEIKHHKQQLAIAYYYKRKEQQCQKPDQQMIFTLKKQKQT